MLGLYPHGHDQQDGITINLYKLFKMPKSCSNPVFYTNPNKDIMEKDGIYNE